MFDDLAELFADDAPDGRARHVSVYLLQLRHGDDAIAALRGALDRVADGEYDLRVRALATGETVVLLLVPAARAALIEQQLADARVERAAVPAALGGRPLPDALARMRPRLAEVERELAAITSEARDLARARGAELARARRGFHDELIALDAAQRAADSPRAFVLEGWLPERARPALTAALAAALGAAITVEAVGRGVGHGEDAPVVLTNPRLFAPFEALTALLPLPRYGTVDPTPFVAVFFPMLFGVVVGDVGYGAVIGAIALALRWRGAPGGTARKVAHIAAPVAIYTIVFGALYGELFGDLGTRLFGMRALWFDRREAVMPFLVLAVALGGAHLMLGLIVAAASRWREDRRAAIGRGITAAMLVFVAVALLALVDRLPQVLLMPAVIALLVALPVVILLEGASALLEFMTLIGHVLSYARVMALGTASVMLAVVANQMAGAFGSAALGIAFALVFHLVNFAITLFSPTIHVMRLHYVEFFGTFFEPGGTPYQPLAHWSPSAT
ncbi:MAG: ATPase [Deltaproteobacteria bacterium]|nr:ATPase [Deltaproteobacteria bacterium]